MRFLQIVRWLAPIFTGIFFSSYCMGGNNMKEMGSFTTPDSGFQAYFGKEPVPTRNTLYLEAFGSSANMYSLNYERCFYLHKRKSGNYTRVSARMGCSYFMERLAIPMLLHFSRGDDNCFESGFGWSPWLSSHKRVDGLAVFAGYKYQPDREGLLARFAFTPTYLVQEKTHWRMLLGFSFGWTF